MRPGRVSIFLKDEVSGFFDSINRKDYLAGMPETMTALYDVPAVMQRMLRKETIRIERPAFIFFGGGVKEKVFESVTEEYVLSGFLPRFCVVMGNTDMAKIRPTGPANDLGMHKRAVILDKIANMYEHYASDVDTSIAGQTVPMPPAIAAEMTTEAWERYAEIEMLMLKVASEDNNKALALPTLDRLSRSLHKMAIILAASNQEPTEENKITVSLNDINNAAWYIQDWGRYSIELINGSTRKASEKLLEKVFQAIQRNPGILRSNILQWYHLTKREADDVLSTLEDRQLVRKEQRGRGWSFYPT